MIFAHGPQAAVFVALALAALVGLVFGPPVGALALQGACSLLNKLAPGPPGTNAVRRPGFGKALGMIALAVAAHAIVTPLVFVGHAFCDRSVDWPLPSDLIVVFLLGFFAMSMIAARMLGAPLWKSAVVMFVPCVMAFIAGFPMGLFVLDRLGAWWAL
jgi:hypothetical protein